MYTETWAHCLTGRTPDTTLAGQGFKKLASAFLPSPPICLHSASRMTLMITGREDPKISTKKQKVSLEFEKLGFVSRAKVWGIESRGIVPTTDFATSWEVSSPTKGN